MISEKDKEDFIESGKITSTVREDSKRLIMIGEPLLDIAETVEQMIADAGAECAFPVTISINERAAHFSPETGCELEIKEDSLVKIDLGAMVNEAPTDSAYTVDLSGKYEKLVDASRDALNEATKLMVPGTPISEISAKIEETIKASGFLPVSNLSGHRIMKGLLHSGVDIPNVRTQMPYILQEGDVFAVEPFATTGSGIVQDADQVEIFSLAGPRPLRNQQARKILGQIMEKRKFMPFAQRWLEADNSRLSVNIALREMLAQRVIMSYPVLKDSGNGMVSQAENTILVASEPIVLTK